MEVRPDSFLIVVESMEQYRQHDFQLRLKIAKEHCNGVFLLYTFSILNEEIVRLLMKHYNLKRVTIPRSILKNPKNGCLKDFSSLTDEEINNIIENL